MKHNKDVEMLVEAYDKVRSLSVDALANTNILQQYGDISKMDAQELINMTSEVCNEDDYSGSTHLSQVQIPILKRFSQLENVDPNIKRMANQALMSNDKNAQLKVISLITKQKLGNL